MEETTADPSQRRGCEIEPLITSFIVSGYYLFHATDVNNIIDILSVNFFDFFLCVQPKRMRMRMTTVRTVAATRPETKSNEGGVL